MNKPYRIVWFLVVCLLLGWWGHRYEVLQLKTEAEANKATLIRTQAENKQLAEALARSGQMASSSEAKHDVGIGSEEMQKQFRERRKRGEYILEYEDPRKRQGLEEFLSGIADREASNNAARYNKLFFDLGVPPETSAKLQLHVRQIHLASLQAAASLGQLFTAREAYRSRLATEMDEPTMAKYLADEAGTHADYELKLIEEHLRARGKPLDPDTIPIVKDLIVQSGAYTGTKNDGPFDGAPEVGVGEKMVASLVERQIATIQTGRAELERRGQSLPPEILSSLKDYYDSKEREYLTSLEHLRDPNFKANQKAKVSKRLEQLRREMRGLK